MSVVAFTSLGSFNPFCRAVCGLWYCPLLVGSGSARPYPSFPHPASDLGFQQWKPLGSETLRAFSCSPVPAERGLALHLSTGLLTEKKILLFFLLIFLISVFCRPCSGLSCFCCFGFLLPTLLLTQMQFLRS